jgi:hypothetical protein
MWWMIIGLAVIGVLIFVDRTFFRRTEFKDYVTGNGGKFDRFYLVPWKQEKGKRRN